MFERDTGGTLHTYISIAVPRYSYFDAASALTRPTRAVSFSPRGYPPNNRDSESTPSLKDSQHIISPCDVHVNHHLIPPAPPLDQRTAQHQQHAEYVAPTNRIVIIYSQPQPPHPSMLHTQHISIPAPTRPHRDEKIFRSVT